ncbi:MAG: ABC transporter permease, partial [Oscillospiraceae bacterium]|nr:ABC transporter permease [Oscillospiraceae bacterium]
MVARGISPLGRKLLRDVRQGWKSFSAVWLICTLAVTLYVGIDATWRGMQRNLDAQFTQSNMADIWVRGPISDRGARDLAKLPGVDRVQRRVSVEGKAKALQGEPVVALLMSEGEAVLDKPFVIQGTGFAPGRKNQCVLQERFALAHGLGIGDTLRVDVGGQWVDMTICGLGTLPEYVVTGYGGEFGPNPFRFGYGVVSPGTLGDVPYGEACLAIAPGADAAAVKAAAQDLLADQQVVALGRENIAGIKMAMDEAQQIRALGAIFPAVFFVIAALITWTTMGRLVENQWLQIGTLFAQGYGRGALMLHYGSYGLLIAAAGALAGLAGACLGIAPLLMNMIGSIYTLPGGTFLLTPGVALGIAGVLALITGGASLLSAANALRQVPAALLRPRPPGKGRRILLEKVPGIWRRLRFSDKMILRNLLRSPARMAMGLVGAMGCAAMMLTGFGMRDSVDYVMRNHYTRTMHYDARVTLGQDAPPGYARAVALRAGATELEEEMLTTCEALVQGEWQVKRVFVLADDHDMINLTDAANQRSALPPAGVALSQKTAEDMGLGVGDTIALRLPGEREVTASVARLVDVQLDQGIYMSKTAWKALDMAPWRATAALLRGPALDLAAAEAMDGVEWVRTLTQEEEGNAAVLDVMDLVVYLMVLFSGMLALVVLYNLGQLNFSERVRELATLMVLGFTHREIKRLVLRENLIIAFVGLPIGLGLGPGLHQWVLAAG